MFVSRGTLLLKHLLTLCQRIANLLMTLSALSFLKFSDYLKFVKEIGKFRPNKSRYPVCASTILSGPIEGKDLLALLVSDNSIIYIGLLFINFYRHYFWKF